MFRNIVAEPEGNMNFVAHYYVDNHLDNSLFVVGVSTPDLVPVYNKNFRLRKRKVEAVLARGGSRDFYQFAKGILRHFEADEYFHSAQFFKEENDLLMELIRKYFPGGEVRRSFFVAHILFELVLDRVLVLDDPRVLDNYYRHWRQQDPQLLSRLTGQILENEGEVMEGYPAYIQRFVERKYLYGFSQWEELLYVFKRIMERVGIPDLAYIYEPTFMAMLKEYESRLIPKVPHYIAEMREELSQHPLD